MLKSDLGGFNPLSAIALQLKKTSAQLIESIGQKQMAPVGLLTVLSFTGIGWLTTAAIAPQDAQAYTASLDVSVNRQTDEPYESFLRRAEAVARAAAQRSFDRDILITDVAVTVLGQNEGAIAPILSLEVSRQSWRNRPDAQRWATYFPNTESLLGFDSPNVTPGTQPGTPPQLTRPIPTPPPPAPTIIEIPGTPVRIQSPGAAPATTPQPANPAAPTAPSAPPTTTPAAPSAPANTAPATPSVPANTPPGATPAPTTPANQPANQPAGSGTNRR